MEVNEDLMPIAHGYPEYSRLRDFLLNEMKAPPRQVLSHHTTTSCQPGRVPGPMGSLKDCGLEQAIPDKGGVRVQLTFQHSFEEGDGRAWTYITGPCTNLKSAQHTACLDVLCLLLWCAPMAVHLAPGSMKNGDTSIDRIREAAQQLKQARQQECADLIMGPIAEMDAATPAHERPEPAWRAQDSYEPPDPNDPPGQRDEEIMRFLRPLAGRPRLDPRVPGRALGRLLPRHGLKPFMQQHSDEITVHEDGPNWTFTVHPRGAQGTSQGQPGSSAGTQGAPASSAGNQGTSAGNLSAAGTQVVPASSAGNPGTSAGNAWSAGTQVVPGSSAGNTSSAGAWDNWTTWHGWPVWKWLEWNEWNAWQGESGEWHARQGEW